MKLLSLHIDKYKNLTGDYDFTSQDGYIALIGKNGSGKSNLLEAIKFLASFIGCSIFEVSQPRAEHIFYTKGRGCDAKGFYSSNGFTVLKGSVIAKTTVPSLKWSDKRNSLVNEYAAIEDDKLVMTSDKTFASPSTAADFCIGSSNNGWLVWKDKDGNTLDSVYRKQLE